MKDMKTKHAPYSLYKKRVGTRSYWYVRYWNSSLRRYSIHRATGIEASGKKERKGEAEKIAADMLPEVCFSAAHLTLLQYLRGFWHKESPYFRELAKVQKKEVSGYYIKASQDIIRLHISPYPPFGAVRLEGLTAGIIRDFMLWLADRGASGDRINRAIQVIRVPLRYAISRDEAKVDPFAKVKPAAAEYKEKGVLTRNELISLVNAPVTNVRHRLAVLLGMLCGMRLGEVRGLCWEDISGGVIRLRHNWQDMDGLKGPKCDSWGDVPVPASVAEVLTAYYNDREKPENGLVFAREKDNKPLCNGFFRLALNKELDVIGIPGTWVSRKQKPEGYVNEQAARNITFHSLRHTFISLSRLAGINEIQMQALARQKSANVGTNEMDAQAAARHKSVQMMNRYSHPRQVVELNDCLQLLEDMSAGTQDGTL
jgi:integrase